MDGGGSRALGAAAERVTSLMDARGFAFPLNVYAHMLALEEGRVDALHYGLFEREDEPVGQAQERASARLWAALPPPCRTLEVGIGLGTTLQRLQAAGYAVVGLTPDAAQVGEARARHGQGLDLRVSTLEAFDGRGGPWELMLFQESAQYIAPLDLFEAADRVLAPAGAQIVVMDEFALQRRDAGDTGLHDLAAFKALARRLGWNLVHEEDLSGTAAGTVAAIARLVRRHRQALRNDLALDDGSLQGLLDACARYAELYASGVYGYRLLRLQRPRRPARRLASVRAAQAPAVRTLLQHTFDVPMSQAVWDWKYGEGRGRAVALWEGEALLAHYGGMTRRVRIDGRSELACQVGDVMVSARANAGLVREGALHQVSATLLEAQIGWGRPHLLGFGFPNARAMKVAERIGLYAPVDAIVELRWPPLTEAERWREKLWRRREIDLSRLGDDDADARTLEQAWLRMAAALPRSVLPERDLDWLRYRYAQRPEVEYRVRLCESRVGHGQTGAYVLRDHGDHVELMDLVGPPSIWDRLLRAARRDAGPRPLHAWVSASHRVLLERAAPGAIEQPIQVTVPSCVHTPGPAPETLRGRWFLMSGDTDSR